jgi:CRP-like cAMP-binding protein
MQAIRTIRPDRDPTFSPGRSAVDSAGYARVEEGPAMEERLELLERVPLFSRVPRDVLERIAAIAEETDVAEGAVLTHEGRHEGYFFVVASGSVRIERGGREVNRLGPGEFFGSIALVDAGPRTASAIAEAPSRLLTITNEEFRDLVDASPELRAAVMNAAEHNLRSMDDETVA